MTPLAVEVAQLLQAEGGHSPLRVDSIRAVLKAARGVYADDAEIQTALDDLLQRGLVEAVRRRGVAHYRSMQPRTEEQSNA